MSNPIDSIVMPTKRGKNYVQFFYNGEDEAFICGVDGHFTADTLDDIVNDFLENPDETYVDAFSKGAGDYLYLATYNPEQRGEFGMVEIAAWWELDEVLFEPLEA
jgi:hypothetical protein